MYKYKVECPYCYKRKVINSHPINNGQWYLCECKQKFKLELSFKNFVGELSLKENQNETN